MCDGLRDLARGTDEYHLLESQVSDPHGVAHPPCRANPADVAVPRSDWNGPTECLARRVEGVQFAEIILWRDDHASVCTDSNHTAAIHALFRRVNAEVRCEIQSRRRLLRTRGER